MEALLRAHYFRAAVSLTEARLCLTPCGTSAPVPARDSQLPAEHLLTCMSPTHALDLGQALWWFWSSARVRNCCWQAPCGGCPQDTRLWEASMADWHGHTPMDCDQNATSLASLTIPFTFAQQKCLLSSGVCPWLQTPACMYASFHSRITDSSVPQPLQLSSTESGMMDSRNSNFEITHVSIHQECCIKAWPKKVGGTYNGHCLSLCSGGYKSEIKIEAGLVPS